MISVYQAQYLRFFLPRVPPPNDTRLHFVGNRKPLHIHSATTCQTKMSKHFTALIIILIAQTYVEVIKPNGNTVSNKTTPSFLFYFIQIFRRNAKQFPTIIAIEKIYGTI